MPTIQPPSSLLIPVYDKDAFISLQKWFPLLHLLSALATSPSLHSGLGDGVFQVILDLLLLHCQHLTKVSSMLSILHPWPPLIPSCILPDYFKILLIDLLAPSSISTGPSYCIPSFIPTSDSLGSSVLPI